MQARRRTGIALVLLALLAATAGVAPPAATAAPAGSTLLVSRPDGLGPVPPAFDNFSRTPGALSADGRYAVFSSDADGFAAGTNPAVHSILLRDTQTSTTTLVSRSDGPQGVAANRDANDPAIVVAPAGAVPDAPTGQPHVLVAFATDATNLADHASGPVTPPNGAHEIWLRDVTAGTTYLVSRADGTVGAAADLGADSPSIDVGPAGPVIAFRTFAGNLGNSGGGIFLRTFDANDTELISCRNNNCAGTPTGADGQSPAVRVVPPDGPLCALIGHPTGCVLVAFATFDMSITNDPGGHQQIAVALADAGTAMTTTGIPTSLFLESRPNGTGTTLGNGFSTDPSFAADGSAVAFLSSATNLTGDTLPANPNEAYVRSLTGTATTLLSTGPSGPADKISRSVSLGGTAGHLLAAFQNDGTNLGSIPGSDVYIRDVAAGTTFPFDRAAGPGGALVSGAAGFPAAISADGSTAMFASTSPNLGDGSDGRFLRVHVRRLASGAVELVSRPDGSAPFSTGTEGSSAGSSSISDDGRYVAFSSSSPSLPGGTGLASQIYRRDLLTGRTVLVSRAAGADGAASDGFCTGQTISGDGRRVAFTCLAGNLSPDVPSPVFQVYVRDLDAQTTELVSRANGPGGTPAIVGASSATISRQGNVVAFVSASALDPAGADGHAHVYARNLAAQTTTLADRGDGRAGAVAAANATGPVPDADGSRVAFATTAALAGAPADGKYHVYLRDLDSGGTVLVSRAEGAAGASANDNALVPSIDADGNVVAFSSYASNLGSTFANAQVFVRDVAGGHTQLASRASGTNGVIAGGTQMGTIDAAGDRVAFVTSDALGGEGTPGIASVFVRDLPSQTTTLVSRADGAAGPPADGPSFGTGIDAPGDCVVFMSQSTNLADGFASTDFYGVHVRVLRNECPKPQPAGAGGASGGGARAAAAARLSRLAIKPKRFFVDGRRGGAKIGFRLDKASRVTLRFDRLLPGHRVKRRCSTRARRGRHCTIVRRAGTLTVRGRKGATSVKFSGKLGRRALPRGSYRLTATPAGGARHTVTFAVTPAPRPKHKRR